MRLSPFPPAFRRAAPPLIAAVAVAAWAAGCSDPPEQTDLSGAARAEADAADAAYEEEMAREEAEGGYPEE